MSTTKEGKMAQKSVKKAPAKKVAAAKKTASVKDRCDQGTSKESGCEKGCTQESGKTRNETSHCCPGSNT